LGNSQKEYSQHLSDLEKSLPNWQWEIKQIEISKLQVSYQNGVVLEKTRNIALGNMLNAYVFIGKIRLTNRLSDEISLFGLLGEINTSMAGLSDDLSQFTSRGDGKRVVEWQEKISKITYDVSVEQVFQLNVVRSFADALQDRAPR
jgi:hypothetical protein